MRGKLRKILSLVLALVLTLGVMPASVRSVEAADGTKPELHIRFTDSKGNPIEKAQPGEKIRGIVSVTNADRLTGIVFTMHYADDELVPTRAAWSSDFKAYTEKVFEGYEDEEGNWHEGTALQPQYDNNYNAVADGSASGSVLILVANSDASNTITTEGMGDIDLFTLYFDVSSDASGEYTFSSAISDYCLDGTGNNTKLNEDPVEMDNTITIEKEPVPMTGFTLSESNISLDLSKATEHKLSVASYTPADTTDTDKPVTWATDNDKIATVDENGNVTAVGKGTTTITASITNNNDQTITQSCSVTVTKSVTSVTLQPEAMTLANGQTKQITATVLPEDADDANVTWTSDDPSVATVDGDGNVKAVSENGTTTITASTANGTKASCAVTVKTSHLEDIGLSETSVDLARNEKKELEVSFTPELSNVTDEVTDVTWTTADDSIVTVTAVDGSDHKQKAEISALKAGTTKITATVESNGKTYTKECEVTVYVPVESLMIAPVADPILKGEAVTVSANMTPADATRYNLVWNTADTDYVEITPSEDNKSCTITGKAAGTATITVTDTYTGKQGTVMVVVQEIPISSVAVNADKDELNKGETVQAKAVVGPAGTTDEDKSVVWSSSNEDVATVSADGLITAVGGGTAKIIATSKARPDVFGEFVIKVNVPLESIAFTDGADNKELLKGQEYTLEVECTPADTTEDTTVTWDVTGDTDAVNFTPDGSTATVEAKKAGKVTVTATVAGKEIKKEIIVKEINIDNVALSVEGKKTVDLAAGSFDIDLIITPDEVTDKITDVQWSSSDPSVATAAGDESGVTVTPASAGITTVSVAVTTDTGVIYKAECEIVVEIPMTALKIVQDGADVTGNNLALLKGNTTELSCAKDPENTTDVIKSVTWASSDEQSVRVSVSGDVATIETLKESSTPVKITATALTESGKEFTAEVYISAEEKHVESIDLSKTELILEEGETKSLQVTYNPEDTTDEKKVTWTCLPSSVAAVDSKGNVTAFRGGTATVRATFAEGIYKECKVIVPIHITSVSADDIQLIRGDMAEITAAVAPAVHDDTVTYSYEIDASQGDPDAVALDGNTVTAVKEGTAYVVVTATGASNYTDVTTVKTTTIKVGVTENHLAESDVTVSVSGTYDEEDGAYYNRIDEKDPKVSVSWAENITDDVSVSYEVAEGTDVASVDENGNLTFLQEGYATIRVSIEAKDGAGNTNVLTVDRKIYVDIIEVEDIAFTEDSKDVTISTGEEKTLTVIYTPEDTTERVLTWTSSDPSIASVTAGADGTAVVKGIKAGVVTITATSESGLETATTVTVKEADKDPGKTDTTDKTDDTKKAVSTGDTANPLLFAVTAILALGVILIVMRRRFRNIY